MLTAKFIIEFFIIFGLAITMSMDDFAVGVAYGLFKTRLSLKKLIIVVLGSATSTYGIMFIGKYVFTHMPDSVADWICLILLSGIGCKMIYDGLKGNDDYSGIAKKNEALLVDDSRQVSALQRYIVGFGLGVDDFAQALGLAMTGFPIVLTVVLLEVAELIMIALGNFLALKGVSKKITGKLNIIPGIVLILIAVYDFFC